MLKKTITYSDLDGNQIVEDFYFNLSAAEIAEMELSHRGGLSSYLQQIINSNDGAAIITAFKEIISKSYGQRSDDGKRFIKSPELSKAFMETDAYSQMFLEMVTSAEASAEFVRGIVPANLNTDEKTTVAGVDIPTMTTQKEDTRPAWVIENREPTETEVRGMSREELLQAFKQKNQKS